MIPRLTAAQFHRFMSSGRTSPALCGCEDDLGGRAGDYVVKLRGGLDRRERGLACEILAAGLAAHFGVAVPEPAIVLIDAEFAKLVAAAEPARAARFRKSVGLNFGSRQLSGVSEWPVDKWIPDAMWQAAVDIFAFDALIQNPDRRYGNQNLFTRGDEVYIYDHELAFSFLEDILPSGTPWRLECLTFLADHVFYRQLRKKPIDLDGFRSALTALPGAALDAVLAEVPSEWNNGTLGKIEQHLRAVAGRAAEFADEVRRRLA